MSDYGDDDSVHSGTSVPSIGEDAADPQVRHLIVSEDCCRAIYRSSGGDQYICPRITQECHKRNHIRMRAIHRGEAAIYEIHRGVRGGFRGVRSDRRLSPEEHLRLIDETRERNRASAALTVGASALTGGPQTVASPAIRSPSEDDAPGATVPPFASGVLPPTQPDTAELLAMIGQLQEQLRLQSVPTSLTPPLTADDPSSPPRGGVPPAITVTNPSIGQIGAPRTPIMRAHEPKGPSTPGATVIAGAPQTAGGTADPPTAGSLPPTPSAAPSPAFATGQSPGPPAPSVSFASTPLESLPSASRWYAIVVGRVPSDTGVYSDFSQVSPKVTGVSGAVFRGHFKTREEAQSYLSGAASIPAVSTPIRKQKWYVVSVGQDPSDRGVYDNWPEVASKVVGVSGAIYQGGFRSQSEAEDFLARTPMPVATPTPSAPPRGDSTTAFPPQPHGPPGYPYYQGPQQTPSPHGHPPTPVPPGAGTYPGHHPLPGYPPPGPPHYSPHTQNPNYHGGAPPVLDPRAHGPGPYGQHQNLGPYGQPGPPSPYGPGPTGAPSPYGGSFPGEGSTYPGMYGQGPGAPNAGLGYPGGPPPAPGVAPGGVGPPASPWAVPGRLVGPDPSTGTKGELWGVKAGEDFSMLQSWCPPGMGLEKQVRFGDQSLDAVGLPGTSSQGSNDCEVARLSEAFLSMASGRAAATHNLLQGTTDTSYKQEKRTTLGSVRSREELDGRLESLTSNQHTVLEHVEGNLKVVLMGAGYTVEDAKLLAHDSPFLRISGDSQHAYIGLHMHLLNIALRHGWDHAKSELSYHVTKLKEIRALYQTRLQVIAHNYCYLRDLQTQKWQTFGIQDLRIRELQTSMGTVTPPRMGSVTPARPIPDAPPAAARSHYCNHCKTCLHAGNKASCFWRNTSGSEARRRAANAVRHLAEVDYAPNPDDLVSD